ncbi:MAG: M28 family peptidase [Gammaproteobacteria bacterium]|nr:M28 family peptidase [Gammaproteobacteria bacterium]
MPARTCTLFYAAAMALSLLLSACQHADDPAKHHGAEIIEEDKSLGDAQRLLTDIRTLSSDAFGGRAPMSEGETRTLDFVEQRFVELGLEPLFADDFRQAVPLAEITTSPEASFTINSAGQTHAFSYGDEVMLWSERDSERISIDQAELVFAGYGIVAPEYQWNDYRNLDVRDKIVVVLVNDPGFASGDKDLFAGRSMTYYGRWTYKFEEAARQGAAGALIVHNTHAASYPWAVVKNSWSGPQFQLQSDDAANASRLQVSGWISEDAAARLLMLAAQQRNASGQPQQEAVSLDDWYARAMQADFAGAPIGLAASIDLQQQIRHAQSYNIGARIRGASRPGEMLIVMTHWDHLGSDSQVGTDVDGIYNGAVDNATGVAALLTLAESLQQMPPADRSIAFLAVTAEESGLLGSAWYARHPPLPMAQHVAGINMDAMNVYGPTRDLVVVGYGQSEMEDYLRLFADQQGRIVAPEETPEAGGFYRSDHFNFAKQGVPMLYADSGSDHVEHGTAWLLEKQQRFAAERYHKPQDEVQDDWDLAGMQQDLWLYQQILLRLANSEVWPAWYEGSEFRKLRTAPGPTPR